MELRAGYKQTEIGVVPEDWRVLPLEEFTSFISYGFTNPMPTSHSGVCMITAKDITQGQIQFDSARCTTEEAYHNLLTAKSRPKKDDLLLTKDGTLGRLALVDDRTVCINQSVALIRPNSKVVPKFLKVLLEAPNYQERMLQDAGGSTIKHIYITIVNRMRVAVPPTRGEQQAIAEALSDADALIESLHQLIAKKRQIKQGAMQELLTGKRRLPGFSGEWEVKRFGEVVQLRKDRVDPNNSGEQDFCVELEHIGQATGCLTGHTVASEGASLKSSFQIDDVLFGKLRAYLRKYWLASRDGCCSTEVWVFIAKRVQLVPAFLFQIVQTDSFVEAASSAYGTHMPRSDWNVVKSYELCLPSIEEQTAIATVLSDMDTELAALESRLAKARQIKQGMMQVLLTGRIRLV